MNLIVVHTRVKYTIFTAMIFLSILIRYPLVAAEFGVDSFFIHSMAESLNIHGRGLWIMDLSSYFGIYPFSYPSAAPFMLSSFSQLSGLSIEHSILLLSLFIGILSFFTAYMFASIFFKNDWMKLLCGFMYSTTPVLIKYTYWTFSARGLLLALMPVILWLAFKPFMEINIFTNKFEGHEPQEKSKGRKLSFQHLRNSWNKKRSAKLSLFILALVMLVFSFTIHYSAWIILAFIIIFFFVIFELRLIQLLTKLNSKSNKRPKLSGAKLQGILIFVLIISLLMLALIGFNMTADNSTSSTKLAEPFFEYPPSVVVWLVIGSVVVIILNMLADQNEFAGQKIIPFRITVIAAIIMTAVTISAFLHVISTVTNPPMLDWMATEGLEQGSPDGSGYKPLNGLDDLGTIIIGRYGPILMPVMLGLFSVIMFNKNSVRSWQKIFLINSSLIILPFMALAPYPVEFSGLLFVILGAVGIASVFPKLKRPASKQLFKGALITLIIIILIFSSFTIAFRVDNEYSKTGDRNYIDNEIIELAIFIKATAGNNSFQDPDHIQTTRLTALTGKEARYYHEFQYFIWNKVEFTEFEIRSMELSWDSLRSMIVSLNRPYDYMYNFTIPTAEYYISPEYGDFTINLSPYPDLNYRFYRVYSNDRVSIYSINEDFERVVIHRFNS